MHHGGSGQVRKISPPPGFDPRTVELVASRYTTILRYTAHCSMGTSTDVSNLINVRYIHFLLSCSCGLSQVFWNLRVFLYCIFLKRFIAQKIQRDTQGYKIVPLTNLP